MGKLFNYITRTAIAVIVAFSVVGCASGAGRSFEGAPVSSSSAVQSTRASTASGEAGSSSGESVADGAIRTFSLEGVPTYSGKASVEVNGGVPYFTADELARGAFEEYAPLDGLGRCGAAFALIGRETMPTEPRGSIGMIRPSGWHTVRYDWVDGQYLYNRCHLIGYQLAGENDNERNLITGTRSLNVQGMLPYENRVADYVEATGNHVLYRSTPVFSGNELVARGVLLEAQSAEDGGVGVRFCVWCYNVEPGVEIDYATGDSHAVDAAGLAADSGEAASEASAQSAQAAEIESPVAPQDASQAAEVTYILNKNSRKFHYPYCSSVDEMAEHNKVYFNGTRDEAIEKGYEPCKRCNP